jgi:hypothetical protein
VTISSPLTKILSIAKATDFSLKETFIRTRQNSTDHRLVPFAPEDHRATITRRHSHPEHVSNDGQPLRWHHCVRIQRDQNNTEEQYRNDMLPGRPEFLQLTRVHSTTVEDMGE